LHTFLVPRDRPSGSVDRLPRISSRAATTPGGASPRQPNPDLSTCEGRRSGHFEGRRSTAPERMGCGPPVLPRMSVWNAFRTDLGEHAAIVGSTSPRVGHGLRPCQCAKRCPDPAASNVKQYEDRR
jgi:hypothetical protein